MRALEMRSKAVGVHSAEVAASENNIGLVYDTQGRFADSQVHLVKA